MIEAIDRLADPTPAKTNRFTTLYALLGIALVVLAGRSVYLQLLQGSEWRSTAEGNRVTAEPVLAPRGIIYDAFDTQLVENVTSTDLFITPRYLPNEEDESLLVEGLPELVPITGVEIQTAIADARRTQREVHLLAALEHEQVLAVEREQEALPGVQLRSSLVRQYKFGHELAPVLGYTSAVTSEELGGSSQLLATDISGKAGLEKTYDSLLRGKHGVSFVEVNASGHLQKLVKETEPDPGHDLKLTLDSDFQRHITTILSDYEQERAAEGKDTPGAAVIALDPRDGSIRALVSYPSFDANIFSQPRLKDQASNILRDKRQLLFNRALTGTYPPGSTIKPFIGASALAEGIINSGTTFLSTGGISVGIWNFPDWKAGGHGTTNIHKAIAESVNTFFYIVTGGHNETRGLGVDKTARYLEDFGWGEITGIDIPGEETGFLPSEEWKEEVKNEPWYIGDTYHLAIGQGDVLVTPLQLAVSTGAISQEGTLHTPHVLAKSVDETGGEQLLEPLGRPVDIPQAHLETIKQGMRQTVTDGSGRRLSSLPIPLAGKTGTAQVGSGDDTHAWFTSFGPFESPELVVVVLLEKGGAGDRDAVPIAENIWRWWIEHRSSLALK